MTEEQYLHERIAALHRQFMKDCDPYFERLARLAATRPVVMYVLDPAVLTGAQIQMVTDLGIYKDADQKETPEN